jgi:hypothetical protein
MKVVQFGFAVSFVAVLAVAGSLAAWAEETTPSATGTPEATTTETAAPPAQSAAAATPPAAGSPEEVVCQRDEAMTGSRLGRKKICMTRREWAELRNESQNVLKEIQTPGVLDGSKTH